MTKIAFMKAVEQEHLKHRLVLGDSRPGEGRLSIVEEADGFVCYKGGERGNISRRVFQDESEFYAYCLRMLQIAEIMYS